MLAKRAFMIETIEEEIDLFEPIDDGSGDNKPLEGWELSELSSFTLEKYFYDTIVYQYEAIKEWIKRELESGNTNNIERKLTEEESSISLKDKLNEIGHFYDSAKYFIDNSKEVASYDNNLVSDNRQPLFPFKKAMPILAETPTVSLTKDEEVPNNYAVRVKLDIKDSKNNELLGTVKTYVRVTVIGDGRIRFDSIPYRTLVVTGNKELLDKTLQENNLAFPIFPRINA